MLKLPQVQLQCSAWISPTGSLDRPFMKKLLHLCRACYVERRSSARDVPATGQSVGRQGPFIILHSQETRIGVAA